MALLAGAWHCFEGHLADHFSVCDPCRDFEVAWPVQGLVDDQHEDVAAPEQLEGALELEGLVERVGVVEEDLLPCRPPLAEGIKEVLLVPVLRE